MKIKPFFEPTKPKEELYNLKDDPYQLNNLANNADYAAILEKLRKETLKFDKEIVPVSDIYNPKSVPGQPFIKWFQKEHPKAYQEMKYGKEVGYKKYSQLYKKSLKK